MSDSGDHANGLALPVDGSPAAGNAESLVMRAARSVPLGLEVSIPISELKLQTLQSLRAGQLFTTDISATEDVPVLVGGALLGWAELDNLDGQMAVRLTRLA